MAPLGNQSAVETPADFTFMHLSQLREAKADCVQTVRIGAPPRGPTNRLATRAIWLNNNRLTTFRYLDIFVESVLEEPRALTWLDLSHNRLVDIDNCLLQFSNLRILYLHGNRITDAKELAKLKGLPELKALTVHGNPVYSRRQYRQHMIALLPQIVSLDFTRITPNERDYAVAVKHEIEA